MKKIIITTIALASLLFGNEYRYKISNIEPEILERMINGNSYKDNCPVKEIDLRYIKLNYIDFNGATKTGELIVHYKVAYSVVKIFRELYNIKYPIREMRLVSDFGGSDFKSIEADNTSAFNCRNIAGTNRWSNHAYGKAIDINPLENPYISKSGKISHKASLKYRDRRHKNNTPANRAMIVANDKARKIFSKYGWSWGGYWRSIKDYQHFEYKK
ncbi:hypothetical protein MNB_SV-15-171 [hydrothermal vent metagenome]|uniref:Peptidase M15C domain-containing protein n=1 Tax=hydrothermal vent metagenome TaxID=652676 RepID=A0A1W1EL99_9ZZZZ